MQTAHKSTKRATPEIANSGMKMIKLTHKQIRLDEII